MNVRVWAPDAQRVEVVTGGRARAMTALEDGHWCCDVDAGAEYAFVLDGEGPFPDPRSRWQPGGVHGASVAVDLAAFAWNDAGFVPAALAEAVIYELHVGTFTPAGTYGGVAERLGYLRDLGVTHIELMPLATFPGRRGWGYDGVCLYAPHPAYGQPHELQALVQAAHDHGIGVLLDVVYNHLGPDGNYLGRFGPYFTDRFKTPWGPAVNFDGAGSDEVRRFFADNAVAWLRDYHFDGLRLDAVHAIFDTRAVHFLEELAGRVRELERDTGRSYALIAESDLNDPRLVRSAEQGGYGLDAHWMDDFHHAVHACVTGERDGYYADFGAHADVAAACQRAYVFTGQYSPFRRRSHGRPPHGVGIDQLVVFSQNHDQIGNRALGERLCHLVSADRARLAAALTILSPFVPLLFQGEEWAATSPFLYFTDHQDEDLARAVRDGRRAEFASFTWADGQEIPDPQDPRTFERSCLCWEEQTAGPHASMLSWYRDLLRIRREHAADAGTAADVELEESGVLAMRRGDLLVLANLGDQAARVSPRGTFREVLLRSDEAASLQTLPAWAVVVAAANERGVSRRSKTDD